MSSKKRYLVSSRCFLTAAVLLLGSNLAQAANITVTATGDDPNPFNVDCTLREAIQSANTDAFVDACILGSGADTITLPIGTYTLDSGLALVIDSDITINGAGADLTVIEGAPGTDGPPGDKTYKCCASIFQIELNRNVTINDVTIQNSMAPAAGAITSAGALTINNSVIRHNYTAAGGIMHVSNGLLRINLTTLRDNVSLADGGAIAALTNSATLNNVTITNNTAAGKGGGVYILSLSDFNINNSTISGNTAEFGGGVYVESGAASINNSTIVNNLAADTPGLGTQGVGGGIFIDPAASASIRNSIVAVNAAAVSSADCAGDVTSLGYNIINDCAGLVASDLPGVDPLLGALADNGGNNDTHTLLTDSPALEGGDPNGCLGHDNALLVIDQRGITRPQDADADADGSAVCDIGALEKLATASPTERLDEAGDNGSFNPLLAFMMAVSGFYLRRFQT